MIKKRAAQIALLSSSLWLRSGLLFSNDQTLDQSLVNKSFFTQQSELCRALRLVDLEALGEKMPVIKLLYSSVEGIVSQIEAQDSKKLQSFFHPRLGVSVEIIDKVLSKITASAVGPLEVSLYKLWALNASQADSKGLYCEDEALTIYPQYGYPLQFALWISFLGKQELSRLFVQLVFAHDKWYIATFHAQKWSHQQKIYENWLAEAKQLAENKKIIEAYSFAEIAKKLTFGSGYYKLEATEQIESWQQSVMSTDQFASSIKKVLNDEKIIHTSPLFAQLGVGLLVRFLLPKELSAVEIRQHCESSLAKLNKEMWFKTTFKGLRCSYTLEGEALDREGRLGSLWLNL